MALSQVPPGDARLWSIEERQTANASNVQTHSAPGESPLARWIPTAVDGPSVMLVHDFVYVAVPSTLARRRIGKGGEAWLAPVAVAAVAAGDEVRLALGDRPPTASHVDGLLFEVDDPVDNSTSVLVPIAWTITVGSGSSSVFRGDLEISDGGREHTRLGLSGRYDPPPPDAADSFGDRLVRNRMAEVSARAFLTGVAEALVADAERAAGRG